MSYSPKMRLPHPENWSAFEDLCWGLWKAIWDHNGTQKNGRNGQPQHGVDVFGRPNNGATWAGVQCKGKDSYTHQRLTKEDIRGEAEKARGFMPKLTEYTVATTAPRDGALQEFARTLSIENMDAGWFSVEVRGWEDIVDLLFEYSPPIAAQYYPQVFGSEMKMLAQKIVVCGEQLLRKVQPSKSPDEFVHEGDTGEPTLANDTPDRVRADVYVTFTEQPGRNSVISPMAMRMVIDTLYAKHQEIVGLSSGQDSTTSDANRLAAALDRATQTSHNGEASGRSIL
jgi:hypothetical protein